MGRHRRDRSRAFREPWVLEPATPRRVATDAAASSDPTVYEGVASLTLNPPVIGGGTGGTAIGRVTLNAPVPAGGVVVTLGSSNVELAATQPSTTIPAGATQGAFVGTTNASYRRFSGLALSVTISATHAATVSATLG